MYHTGIYLASSEEVLLVTANFHKQLLLYLLPNYYTDANGAAKNLAGKSQTGLHLYVNQISVM